MLECGVDVELDDYIWRDLGVVHRVCAQLPESARRDSRRPGMLIRRRGEHGGQLDPSRQRERARSSSNAQPAPAIDLADDECVGRRERAEDTANDGFGAEPGPEPLSGILKCRSLTHSLATSACVQHPHVSVHSGLRSRVVRQRCTPSPRSARRANRELMAELNRPTIDDQPSREHIENPKARPDRQASLRPVM
jgi:hypothetical protein